MEKKRFTVYGLQSNNRFHKSYLINHTPSPQHGFTLIEMLVVVALMSILVAIGSNVFISILKSNNKSLILTQVREEGNKGLDIMQRSIQNASEVVYPQGTVACAKYIILRNKPAPQSSGSVYNTVGQNALTRIGFVNNGTNNNYISLNTAAVDQINSLIDPPTGAFNAPIAITNVDGTTSVNVKFSDTPQTPCFAIGRPTNTSGVVPTTVVTVNFTLEQSKKVSAERNENLATVDFQSTFALRQY